MQDALNDIEACMEYANHLQIAHHDEIWLRKAGGDEAFQAFQVLEGSTLLDNWQQWFLNAVQLVGQKKPPQQRANTLATCGESSNHHAHWHQNRGQPPHPFQSGAPAQPSMSMYGQGASMGASRN